MSLTNRRRYVSLIQKTNWHPVKKNQVIEGREVMLQTIQNCQKAVHSTALCSFSSQSTPLHQQGKTWRTNKCYTTRHKTKALCASRYQQVRSLVSQKERHCMLSDRSTQHYLKHTLAIIPDLNWIKPQDLTTNSQAVQETWDRIK